MKMRTAKAVNILAHSLDRHKFGLNEVEKEVAEEEKEEEEAAQETKQSRNELSNVNCMHSEYWLDEDETL